MGENTEAKMLDGLTIDELRTFRFWINQNERGDEFSKIYNRMALDAIHAIHMAIQRKMNA